jgi:hypothetical protein
MRRTGECVLHQRYICDAFEPEKLAGTTSGFDHAIAHQRELLVKQLDR